MKRIAILLVMMMFALPALAGLKEDRGIKDFQDNSYPQLKKEIDAVTGVDVQIEVDWNSIAVKDSSHLYKEGFTKVYFQPLINAFKQICNDDMGKSALQKGLKKVIIKNSSNHYSPSKFSFKDDILVIDHSPTSNLGDIKDRTKKIVKLLEAGL